MDETQCKLCGSKVKTGHRMMHLMRNHQDELISWEKQWRKNHSAWEFMKKITAKNTWCNNQFKHSHSKGKFLQS